MKTIGELIHSLKLENVLQKLRENYQGPGEDEEGYKEVWAELQIMQPAETKLTCFLSKQKYLGSDVEYIHVSGLEPNDDQPYAIEFVPWNKWLSMPIKLDSSIGEISEEEQLAHCLYEMTWAGYTQKDIEDKAEEIHDIIEEAKGFNLIEKDKLN